ncbi:MAG: DUF374 domain-containing protein [bacterium]|nr:DUF374 domain-containing protein [bacterium]
MKAQLLSMLVRGLARTWTIRVEGTLPTAPGVVAFWHGEMLPIWCAFANKGNIGMASSSKDGGLLNTLLRAWGYKTIRGSSSKGGREALDDMIVMATTRLVLVTPDGPRGPAHVCKPGCVVVAQRAQIPLTLVRAYASRARVFKRSWDTFMLPLPFAHITLHVSHPISVSQEIVDLEETIAFVTHRLNHLGSITC